MGSGKDGGAGDGGAGRGTKPERPQGWSVRTLAFPRVLESLWRGALDLHLPWLPWGGRREGAWAETQPSGKAGDSHS